MAKEIPDDISFTILSKLPLKSLNRFTCVHKSWAGLLQNPYFMTIFRANFLSKHHSYYNDTSLLLQQTPHLIDYLMGCGRPPYLLSGDKFQNRVKLDWPLPFQVDDRFIVILGSGIHGTFCLNQSKKFVLWNPATEEFRIIPPSPLDSPPDLGVMITTPHGFGYDPVRDDFKVIRELVTFPDYTAFEDDWPIAPDPSIFWEIYSLRSNSWRKLDAHMPIIVERPAKCTDTYVNGVCHWLGIVDLHGDEEHLASFNLSNEVFLTTPLPFDLGDRSLQKCLVVLNGSIAVISESAETTFHISILGELGVKESWTKLFTIGPLPWVGFPIGVGNKGDVFLRKEEKGELALFDLSSQMLEDIVTKEQLDSHRIIIYKESPLQIGQTEY